jgi:ubiquinone/menaquinone biosynthesis C-methylase UbiE
MANRMCRKCDPSQLVRLQLPRKDFDLAVDHEELTGNLRRFYDFTGKTVLFVGAGGRQFLDPSFKTKRLIAIDRNVEALGELKRKIAARGEQGSLNVRGADFEEVTLSGDTVYFEFCLHETVDPQKTLAHARALAPDVVVFDHSPGSDWSFYVAEEERVRRSAEAMKRFGIRRRETVRIQQRFNDYVELLAKVAEQGTVAIQRVQRFAGTTNIVIPMNCELALL